MRKADLVFLNSEAEGMSLVALEAGLLAEADPNTVLVFSDRTLPWPAAALTAESLAPIIAHGGVELLLLGLGRRMAPVAASLRAWFKSGGIALEAMDTGAACRTYNVLLAEDRRVAAALLPPI